MNNHLTPHQSSKETSHQDQTASSKQSARCTFVGQTKSCPSFQSQSGTLENPPKSDFQPKEITSEQEVNRSRKFTIRLTQNEFIRLDKKYKRTMFRKMSEYLRALLLEKNITVTYRDRSMDDLLEELILLRKELNAIGNNFNQTVHKLNASAELPEAKFWLSMVATLKDKLEPKVSEIKERINQYSETWSQKLSAGKASSVP